MAVGTPDASTGDAADARTGGDSGISDAGAGDASDAASPDPDLPCNQQGLYAFCDDWDFSSTPQQNWDGVPYVLADSGVALLDTTTYVSAPKALQVVVSPVTGTTAGVQLVKTLSAFPAGLRLAFDVRIDSPTYTSFPQVGVAQMYIRQGPSQVQVNFVVGPGSAAHLEAHLPEGGAGLVVTATTPALGTWVRKVVSYTSVDGMLALWENGQLPGAVSIGAGPAGAILFLVGGVYVNPTGTETVTLEMDNVVVKAQAL